MKSHKREKYVPLMKHIKRSASGWVDFIPCVIGATGVVTKDTVVSLKRLDIELDISWL